MELLNIVIVTLISTLLIISLGNIKRQNDQIIIFLTMLAGLMIINLCVVKKKENFSTLDIYKKFLGQYKNQKFEGIVDLRRMIKNFKELHNPRKKPDYSTKVIKLT
tara:strand:- start:142 stop:459 length:318 start_codon:yes stop_codon:yes gene_type:complete